MITSLFFVVTAAFLGILSMAFSMASAKEAGPVDRGSQFMFAALALILALGLSYHAGSL